MSSRWLRPLPAMLLVLASGSAVAGPVHIDYTNMDARLDTLATSAGVTSFSAAEKSTIKSNISSGITSAYSAFNGLSFSTTAAGTANEAVINFGLTTAPGGLGLADHIDFLNRDQSDVARVFTANFGFIIDEFSGSTSRGTQITQLSQALAGTAIHELGHNLGLRHHDAYGDLTYTGNGPGGGGPILTGGAQNAFYMATGSTGLNEAGREADRSFTTQSLVKLAYADGTLSAGNPTSIGEAGGDAGGTAGTAQNVTLENIAVAGRDAEVVVGALGTNNDIDMFAVELAANSTFSADINIDYCDSCPFINVDTRIELLDANGIVLADDLVSIYSATTFGSGSSGDGFDPAYFNVAIATAGTYYVRVTSENSSGSGDYQLLMHGEQLASSGVPEPAPFALLALGTFLLALGRRKPVRG